MWPSLKSDADEATGVVVLSCSEEARSSSSTRHIYTQQQGPVLSDNDGCNWLLHGLAQTPATIKQPGQLAPLTHSNFEAATVQHRKVFAPQRLQLVLQRADKLCALGRRHHVGQEADQVGKHARARDEELHVRSSLSWTQQQQRIGVLST